MTSTRVLLALIFVFGSPRFVLTTTSPGPVLDLPALASDADLIGIGTVSELRPAGRISIDLYGQSIPGRRLVAVLQLKRLLKGDIAERAVSFEFALPDAPIGYAGIAVSQFGMFFLRQASSEAHYTVVSPYYPSVVASVVTPPPTSGNALDRVVGELAYVLVSSQSTPDERRRAAYALRSVRTEAATAALRLASTTLDGTQQLYAAVALLERGDISVLETVAETLLDWPERVDQTLLRNLAFSIRSGVRVREAIPTLRTLLRARQAEVRQAASAALRHTGLKEAIEPLSLALEDSDREVRYQAVIGLAEITRDYSMGPSIEVFERDEQTYLRYWLGKVRSK